MALLFIDFVNDILSFLTLVLHHWKFHWDCVCEKWKIKVFDWGNVDLDI